MVLPSRLHWRGCSGEHPYMLKCNIYSVREL